MINYFFITIIILISGNEPAVILGDQLVYPFCLFLFILLGLVRPRTIRLNDISFLLLFTFLFLIQFLIFGSILLAASVGFLIKILIAMLGVRLIPNFFDKFITVMVYICVIALIFNTPKYFGIDTQSIFSPFAFSGPNLGEGIVHLGIHNYDNGSIRNSGLFWEPGAFGGYIVLTLMLMVLKQSAPRKRWHIWVLIAALLSSMSTMAYFSGFFLLIIAIITSNKMKKLRFLGPVAIFSILVLLVPVGYYSFISIDFIGEKVQEQLESTSNAERGFEINRFGNILFDLEDIKVKPFFGWGANPETRFLNDPNKEEIVSSQGVGLTGILVRFGLIGALLIYYFMYVGFYQSSRSKLISTLSVFLILIILIGEQFQNFPLFYTLEFMNRKSRSIRQIRWK